MLCPNCSGKLKVLDTISSNDVNHRHRKCLECGFDFFTDEIVVERSKCEYLFQEWSRERRKKHEAKKRGEVYEPRFVDGRENKPTPKLPTSPLF